MAAIDLGAILAGRHETNEENLGIMNVRLSPFLVPPVAHFLQTLRGMSKTRDPNAPISLNSEERIELESDPELVEFRQARAKVISIPFLIFSF